MRKKVMRKREILSILKKLDKVFDDISRASCKKYRPQKPEIDTEFVWEDEKWKRTTLEIGDFTKVKEVKGVSVKTGNTIEYESTSRKWSRKPEKVFYSWENIANLLQEKNEKTVNHYY